MISTLTHLCLNPVGALGVSKYDGGVQTFLRCVLALVWLAREVVFLSSFFICYSPSVSFNCLAYSSSGTRNFLAIATCDGVSLTLLRLALGLRVAEATFCIGLLIVLSTLSNF